MARAGPRGAVSFALYSIFLLHVAQCQTNPNDSITYNSLVDLFPALKKLETDPPKPHPRAGLQYTPRCCLQAVNESYEIVDGEIYNIPNRYLSVSAPELNKTQFPCGAEYEDNHDGAEEVRVPYSWCRQNCGGWQRSSSSSLNEWVQPFVGFILPSAVFCLQIPRKFDLPIEDELFSNDFKHLPEKWEKFIVALTALITKFTSTRRAEASKSPWRKFVINFAVFVGCFVQVTAFALIKVVFAAFIALLKTIIAIAVVFSAATPMILSGLYEAGLDRKIIKSIRSLLSAIKGDAQRQSDQRGMVAHETDGEHFSERIHCLYAILVGNLLLPKHQSSDPSSEKANSVWDDVKTLVDGQRGATIYKRTTEYADPPASHKKITATRLKAILDCQVSFGTAVGAPIVFFLGSFLYSVISNHSSLGENNTSHALAFGMWWMTIPHVAIISGCLLAVNNPYVFEAVVVGETDPTQYSTGNKLLRRGQWYRSFCNTTYTPAWMSKRGRNKQQWMNRIAELYRSTERTPESHLQRPDFQFKLTDWIKIVILAVILIVFPFVLAFLTSYYTPRIGMACRSLNFLLYFIFQVCYGLLWVWDLVSQHHTCEKSDENGTKGSKCAYRILFGFVATCSCFMTVLGTVFQIVGLYRNCLCAMPVWYWIRRDTYITLSSNSKLAIKLAIKLAQNFWLPTGIASIASLVTTCYCGWWYQRHWKKEFREVVDMVCRHVEECEMRETDTEANSREGGRVGTREEQISGSSQGTPKPGSAETSGASLGTDAISSVTPNAESTQEPRIARKPLGSSQN